MQIARVRLDVQLSGGGVVVRCDDDLDVAIAPELRDAIRCLPGSCVIYIDPSRLPTATNADGQIAGRAAEVRASAAAVRERAGRTRANARAVRERCAADAKKCSREPAEA